VTLACSENPGTLLRLFSRGRVVLQNSSMEGDLEWFERNYSHLDVEIVRDVFHSVGPDPDAVMQNLKMLVRAS
jgi:hypothetical protein